MKNTPPLSHDDDWAADWEGHRRWQLTAGLAATAAQRLDWLEEMIELARVCGALEKKPDSDL
jgi:hypothetical protein